MLLRQIQRILCFSACPDNDGVGRLNRLGPMNSNTCNRTRLPFLICRSSCPDVKWSAAMYCKWPGATRLHVNRGGGFDVSSTREIYCAEALEQRVLLSAGVPDAGFDGDGFRTLPIGIAENVHMVGGGKVLVVG